MTEKTIYQLDRDDLRDIIKEVLHEAISDYHKSQEEEVLLSVNEVQALLGVAKSTLWHWAKDGYLPSVKVGTKVRYRKSDIDRLVCARNRKGAAR